MARLSRWLWGCDVELGAVRRQGHAQPCWGAHGITPRPAALHLSQRAEQSPECGGKAFSAVNPQPSWNRSYVIFILFIALSQLCKQLVAWE